MKILNWFKNRSGKVALSALQMAGLGVVGAAGLFGAYSLLSSPGEEATSISSYNPGEIVYVSGASGGSYQSAAGGLSSAAPTPGGEKELLVSNKTLQRINEADRRDQISYDFEAQEQQMAQSMQAYQMGPTEGLNNDDPAKNLKELTADGGMGAMAAQMQNMQNMMAQMQQQATQGAQAGQAQAGQAQGAQEGQNGLPGALAGFNKGGMAKVSGGGSGGASNVFSIQNSGKNKGGANGGASMEDAGNALAAAQAQMAAAMEGARMSGKASFGRPEGLGGDKDASTSKDFLGTGKGANELRYVHKRSVDAGLNKNRATNEGSRAFLSSDKISGGMTIASEHLELNEGQSSKDFSTAQAPRLAGIRQWGDDVLQKDRQRKADRHNLQTMFWWAAGISLAFGIAIPFVKRIPFYGKIAALIMASVATAMNLMVGMKALDFATKYGGEALSTWVGVGSLALTAGVWLSFFLSSSNKLVQTTLSLKGVLGFALVGAGVGAGISSLTSSGGDSDDIAIETEKVK